ncbi:MAG: fibronectin type III domain-containing protein [Pseudomonadota bacterium]
MAPFVPFLDLMACNRQSLLSQIHPKECFMPFQRRFALCLEVLCAALVLSACSQSIDVGSNEETFDASAAITLKNVSNTSTATAVSYTEIIISWTAVSGASLYSIERSPNENGSFVEIAIAARNSLSYLDPGLEPATTYLYRVRAAKVFQNRNAVYTPYSNIVSATTPDPLSVPAAPSGLVASASGSQIVLTWQDNSDNETKFSIERCVGAGCTNYTPYAEAGADTTSFIDTNVTAGTTYCYRVRACNSAGCSAYSNTFCVAISLPPNPPEAPSRLIATASGNQIVLTWQDNSSNETRFEIERCEGTGCTNYALYAQVGAGVATFTDSSVVAGTTYCYRVRACNADGCSGYSNIFCTLIPIVAPLAAPSGLVAVPTATQIVLTWQDNSTGETRFEIERCQGAGCTNYAPIAQVGSGVTTFTDTNVTSGNTYCYRVRACDANGCSGYSNTFCATASSTPPAVQAPTGFQASVGEDDSHGRYIILLSWTDNSANEDRFELQNCIGKTCTNFGLPPGWTSWDIPSNTSAWSDWPNAAGFYRYRTRACTGATCSDWSNIATVAWMPLTLTARVVSLPTEHVEVDVQWSDVVGGVSFTVNRGTSTCGACLFDVPTVVNAPVTRSSVAGQPDTVTFTDSSNATAWTPIAPANVYRYRVIATLGDGTKAYGAMSYLRVPGKLGRPRGFYAQTNGGASVQLNWANVSYDETGFEIQRCLRDMTQTIYVNLCVGSTSLPNEGFSTIGQASAGAESYTDSSGLVMGTTYLYRARAVRGADTGLWNADYQGTEYAAAATPEAKPNAPTGLTATVTKVGAAYQVTLNWVHDGLNVDAFQIVKNYYYLYPVLSGSSVRSWIDTDVIPGSTYRYQVLALNAAVQSDFSGDVTLTIPNP